MKPKKHFLVILLLLFGAFLALLSPTRLQAADTGTPIRIACVGDSITAGFTSTGYSQAGYDTASKPHSYPTHLKNLLGNGYEVSNYGLTGYKLIQGGDKPYYGSQAHKDSLASNPNIVLLMLGTNDSRPENWESKDRFLPELKAMIQEYQNLPSKPEVYVCTSPQMNWDYEVPDAPEGQKRLNREVINKEIVPLQKQAAKETGCRLIDVNAFTEKNFTFTQKKANYDFSDYCHPTDVGYQKLANFIYSELTGREVTMEIIDDTDALSAGKGFTFRGSGWVTGNRPTGSINGKAGSEHYAIVTEANAASYSYEIAFTGTRIQVYGHLSKNHGIVKYSVDGGEETEFDSYSATNPTGNTLLYQAFGLSNGPHILKAVATGRKNEAAENACIQVDYAKVFTEKRCTCAIEKLELTDGEITIPWDKDTAEYKLTPVCTLTPCELTAHRDLEASLAFSVTDTDGIAAFDQDTHTLTLSKPGRITVSVTAAIPDTDVTARAEAVLEVKKEDAPKKEDEDKKPGEGTETPGTKLPPAPLPDPKPPVQNIKLARPKLKVKKSGTKAKLSWKKNKKADGYQIQMKTGKGKYKKIASKKMKVTSFTKKKLKKNTIYRFRMRSFKKTGTSTVYSPWSKAVKIRLS